MSNLNVGQTAAAEAFFNFLYTNDVGFIISGAAGVGKTFMMSHIIDTIIPRYNETCRMMGLPEQFKTVNMTATTNKAAEALSIATGRETGTIHSFLRLRVQEDFVSGKTILKPNSDFIVHENQIIFVDECSMVDGALFKMLQEATHNCKIVYVGDHSQLSPIFEDLSPVYKQGYQFFELTEQMRNSGQPALMDLCAQLRETVKTGVFNPIKMVPNVIEHLEHMEFGNELKAKFSTQNLDDRILAYTNARVIDFNSSVREFRQLPAEFTVGEALINNHPIKVNKRQIAVESELTIRAIHGTEVVSINLTNGTSPIDMTVQICDLENKNGERFNGIKIPMNTAHYKGILKYLAQQKMYAIMYGTKETYPDLRQRDASTVHKSQGSTYDTVYIDAGDISNCRDPDQAARMLYVACSRPRNRIVFYGDLAPKFGGLTL